ncbi:MAG: sugar transferase [Candidatus Aenigmarchaeota archaeon]|nr:sugar transferase [Candidatus Aenigmarchaeota archaeon]
MSSVLKLYSQELHPRYPSKRILDIVSSGLFFLVSLPIILPIMALIKMESEGPIIFSQKRYGQNKEPFTVYKLRTMYSGNDNQPVPVDSDDERLTRVGKIIRKYRVDELPQLLNTLTGDLSMVGPRAYQELNAKEMIALGFDDRFDIPQGIVCYSNLEEDSSIATPQKKMELDRPYIDAYKSGNYSLLEDIRLLCRTVAVMIKGYGI